MEIIEVEIDKLIPAEYNPRFLTEKAKAEIWESILQFGMVEPIVVNNAKGRENVIIGGHQRWYICKEMGKKTMPVVYVAIDDPEREKELNLRLNKNVGDWDWDMLANFDEQMLRTVGFDEELDKLFQKEVEEDEAPAVSEGIPESKLGEVYQLGRHRLMCGDATKIEDVEKLMDGQKADMLLCDPPYGIDLDTDYSSLNSKLEFVKDKHLKKKTGNTYDKVIGDSIDYDPSHLFTMFPDVKEMFLWGGDYYLKRLPDGGSFFVWDKRGGEQFDKMYGSCFELCWSKNKHKRDIIRHVWAGVFGTEQEDIRGRIHPTQKPIAVSAYFIKNYSQESQNIVDLFGGSGSTLIACEQTNRTCYMMEIDPKYCDVIRKRYANLIEKGDQWQSITKPL